MKIVVLVDNNTRIDRYLYAEPAFSIFIEAENKKILFDTGYSDILLKNAKSLGISLDEISEIIISHGHDDHTGGLRYLVPSKSIRITAHPNIFDLKKDENGVEYGCPISKDFLRKNYALNLSATPFYLTKNLLFLGEIENNSSDDIDDSAIVAIVNKKLLLITGCSHSGIKNIISYAKKVTGINEIYGVMGGLHLIDKGDEVLESVSIDLRNEKLKFLAPCHCCDLYSKIYLSKYNQVQEVCVGDVFEF